MSEFKFNDKETIEAFAENLNLIIQEDKEYDAYLFSKRLQELLEIPELISSLSLENQKKYEEMVLQAKFISLYKLEDNELLDLFNNHFNIIFKISFYNLIDKIEHFLIVNKYFLEERDEFKEKIRKSLLDNKIKITTDEIKINEQKVLPTIANWLKDFRNEFTENGFEDPVKINEYLINNNNINKLSKKDKKRIELLLSLYSRLKLSSQDPQGMEENLFIEDKDGNIGTLRKGNFEKIPQSVIDLYNQVKDIGAQPAGKSNQQKVFTPSKTEEDIKLKEKQTPAIEKLLADYQKFEADLSKIDFLRAEFEKYNKDVDKLSQRFKTSKKGEAIAVLIFICQNKLLNLFFLDNQDLLLEFKKYLSQKFSPDLVENIVKNSTQAEMVSLYLQFLLNEKLKLYSKDSGLIGMHLANIFKKNGQKSYFPIVYGDTNLEQFVWRDIIEEAGEIKFK